MNTPVDDETQACIDWLNAQLTDEDRAERAKIDQEIRGCMEHLQNWEAERAAKRLAQAA